MKDYFKKLKQLFRLRDLVFTVLLFSIILGIAFCKAESQVEVTFNDASVDVVSARYSMNIPYDMVAEIDLVEYIQDSTLLKGKGDISLQTGTWTNEVWGEYFACVDLGSKQCVKVKLEDGRLFVFSRLSDEETATIFETFQSHLEQ